jgi:hypothetical protein
MFQCINCGAGCLVEGFKGKKKAQLLALTIAKCSTKSLVNSVNMPFLHVPLSLIVLRCPPLVDLTA